MEDTFGDRALLTFYAFINTQTSDWLGDQATANEYGKRTDTTAATTTDTTVATAATATATMTATTTDTAEYGRIRMQQRQLQQRI